MIWYNIYYNIVAYKIMFENKNRKEVSRPAIVLQLCKTIVGLLTSFRFIFYYFYYVKLANLIMSSIRLTLGSLIDDIIKFAK